MKRNYKFRIYPSKSQERKLLQHIELCRLLYNSFLEKRIEAYNKDKSYLSGYDQVKTIPQIKIDQPEFKEPYADVLQNVALRLEKTYSAFFTRVKRGEKAGFPRFKAKNRYRSITYPDFKKSIKIQDKRIKLPKIGLVKIIEHRTIIGTPKNVTICFDGLRWYAIISCDLTGVKYKKKKIPKKPKTVGIDVGIENFATFSSGEVIANPRFFESEQKKIAKAQRQKKDRVVTRLYRKVKDRRDDFTHKQSKQLVKNYHIICIEDIETNKLIKKRWCSKQISDVAWSDFFQKLCYKAESAGSIVIKVNPAYTSQTCSSCGTRKLKDLSDRNHDCDCGFSTTRDHNAAINILRLGLQSPNVSSRSPSL